MISPELSLPWAHFKATHDTEPDKEIIDSENIVKADENDIKAVKNATSENNFLKLFFLHYTQFNKYHSKLLYINSYTLQ